MSKYTSKIFSVLSVLTLVSASMQSVSALSATGGSYADGVSAYQEKWMPYSESAGGSTGSSYDQNISKLKESFGVGSGSAVSTQESTSGNKVTVSGGSTGVSNKVTISGGSTGVSNKVTVGGGSYGGGNYGSSAIPGGYQYNPGVSNKVTVGGGSDGVSNKVTVSGGGNYGSSAIPGGYQYNPEVSNKVAMAASSYGNVDNKVALGTNDNDGGVDNKVPYNPGSFDGDDGYDDNKVPYNPGSFDDDNDDNKVPYNPGNFDENEPEQTEDISLCQNRPYPRDIDGHWSEIYVRRLYDLCVVEGYEDGNFRPNANVTRAELVKMGLFANGIEPNNGCYDNDCGSPFNDLDSWQGKWVRPAWDRKIIEGYAYNQFKPNQAITRAEAVKVVLATYGYSRTGDNKSFFNDVHGWSVGWVERARLIGLVQGIGNGNFDPDRPITRAEAAKIVAKMIEYWDTSVAKDNANR